jgi:hypothetical protein
MTNGTGANFNFHFTVLGRIQMHIFDYQRLAECVTNRGFHDQANAQFHHVSTKKLLDEKRLPKKPKQFVVSKASP